jgi:hypothetical protein
MFRCNTVTEVNLERARRALVIVMTCLGLSLAVLGQRGAEQKKTPSQRTFVSSDRTFELTVPGSYPIYSGNDVSRGTYIPMTYIPLCQDDAIVCFVYPGAKYKGTNFEGAAVQIKVVSGQTRRDCAAPADHPQKPDAASPTRMIGGISFVHYRSGGAAMSHYSETNEYRGFANGKCYELDASVTFANFFVYAPGAIKKFTRQDDKRVTAGLIKVVDSFKMVR